MKFTGLQSQQVATLLQIRLALRNFVERAEAIAGGDGLWLIPRKRQRIVGGRSDVELHLGEVAAVIIKGA